MLRGLQLALGFSYIDTISMHRYINIYTHLQHSSINDLI